MHPWITGRIVDTMQHEARQRAVRDGHRHRVTRAEPRRERLGLAIARVGYRIAGGTGGDERLVTGWTTCGATSTSTR